MRRNQKLDWGPRKNTSHRHALKYISHCYFPFLYQNCLSSCEGEDLKAVCPVPSCSYYNYCGKYLLRRTVVLHLISRFFFAVWDLVFCERANLYSNSIAQAVPPHWSTTVRTLLHFRERYTPTNSTNTEWNHDWEWAIVPRPGSSTSTSINSPPRSSQCSHPWTRRGDPRRKGEHSNYFHPTPH